MSNLSLLLPRYITMFTFVFCNRAKFIYYMCVLASYSAVIELLKLTYANPRPFMISNDIKAFDCVSSFGNPSGNSFVSA